AMVGPLRDGWAAPTAPSAGPTLAALGAAAHTTRAQSARASLPPRLQPGQQLIVAWRRRNPLDQPLHRGLRRHLRQPPPQRIHAVDLVRPEELLLAARAARPNVDRRIDALLGESTIELDLTVARALELLEDHVVHARAGFDERRRDDRQRSAARRLRNGARRSEKGLGLRHRRGV